MAPLCVVFVVSAALSFVDPDGTRASFETLGFPAYIGTYPLAVAKLLGVFAVVWGRSSTLTMFAYAGFLFDMLLAFSAQVYEGDFPAGWLAVIGLVLWTIAFRAEHRRLQLRERVVGA